MMSKIVGGIDEINQTELHLHIRQSYIYISFTYPRNRIYHLCI